MKNGKKNKKSRVAQSQFFAIKSYIGLPFQYRGRLDREQGQTYNLGKG